MRQNSWDSLRRDGLSQRIAAAQPVADQLLRVDHVEGAVAPTAGLAVSVECSVPIGAQDRVSFWSSQTGPKAWLSLASCTVR